MSKLTFDRLRNANVQRAGIWHAGVEWNVADRITESMGENGELAEAMLALITFAMFQAHSGAIANIAKKIKRIDGGMVGGDASKLPELIQQAKDEMGDAQICLDLLAMQFGFDLADCTARKFNKTSIKHGLPVHILCDFDTNLYLMPAENNLPLSENRDFAFPVHGKHLKPRFIDQRYLDEPALIKSHGKTIAELKESGGLLPSEIVENILGDQYSLWPLGLKENFVDRLCFIACQREGCKTRSQKVAGGPCVICYE